MDTRDSTLGETKHGVVEFLLAEFETLRELRAKTIEWGEGRANLYLTIAAGAAGLLTLTNQFTSDPLSLYLTSFAILIGLFLLGVLIFARLVTREILVTNYTRGINRIRRYFLELDPSIRKYLILPASDDTPKYYSVRPKKAGLRTIVGLIVSIDAAALTSILFSFISGSHEISWPQVVSSIVVLVVTYILLDSYSGSRLRAAEDEADVQFPRSS